jgi:uncharacterized damage-inducible protein DinB
MSELEPWLRGTLGDVPAVQRAVLHALELAQEDVNRWCEELSDEELNSKPLGLASIAFHLCHMARSIDRLLTYAEGRQLSETQLLALRTESRPGANRDDVLAELAATLDSAAIRVRAFDPGSLEQARSVGRKRSPSTLGGLLVHIADHTQRHVGQVITTVKILVAQRRPLAKAPK